MFDTVPSVHLYPLSDDSNTHVCGLFQSLADPFQCCRAIHPSPNDTADVVVMLDELQCSETSQFSTCRSSSPSRCSTPSAKEADQPDQAAEAARPDLNGKFILDRVGGDFELFMADMGQGWVTRKGAAALGYGVGMVRLDVHQTGDEMVIHKVLALGGCGHTEFRVGACDVAFRDDIGIVINATSWEEHNVLRLEGTLKGTKLGVRSRLSIDESGEFVHEMTSSKGTSVFIIFRPRI
jgi:hypothetical protein